MNEKAVKKSNMPIKQTDIPQKTGCYLFFDGQKKVIYAGKAVNLRSRVLSYWREGASHSPLKHAMMKKIKKIKWIQTDSEVEALLLEANLIKKYAPEFNIIMRDDKRYSYIKISTEEDWPRIFLTRKIEKTGKYFGPFVSAESIRETLKVLRKIWPYRSCRLIPKKACLYYHIGKCPGVCEQKTSKKEYNKIIRQITLFLEGKKESVVMDIEKNIKKIQKKEESDSVNIQLLKYRLFNLNKILENTKIISMSDKYIADVIELAKTMGLSKVPNRIEGYDISNIYGKQAVGSMVVFVEGEPDKNEYRKFKIKNENEKGDVGMLKEVIERRFLRRSDDETAKDNEKRKWEMPDLIVVDGGKAQLNVISKILKTEKLDIPVLAISKGEGLRSAHAPDKIFFPGEKKPLELPLASPALHIIKRVRDEAHRFAIGFHKKLRAKRMFK